MRAVRCTEAGISLVEVPAPLDPPTGPAWAGAGPLVRVRPRSVGICQTDVNLLRLGPRPTTFGHEFAGVTDDGTPVAVEPLVPCGACDPCRTGDTAWCERNYLSILGVGLDGAMADEVWVPRRCLSPLPAGLPVADAALCEPLAVNLHSLALARLEGRHRVAVCGPGITGFGLLGGVGARWRGCPTVDLDPLGAADHARDAAERLGLGTTTAGTYDLVVEGDGSEASIARAAELCRPGGTVLLVAGYYRDTTFRVLPFVAKELTCVWGTFYGHHAAGRSFDNAAALLAQWPEVAAALVTHRLPLDAVADAFALVTGDTPTLKVLLEV